MSALAEAVIFFVALLAAVRIHAAERHRMQAELEALDVRDAAARRQQREELEIRKETIRGRTEAARRLAHSYDAVRRIGEPLTLEKTIERVSAVVIELLKPRTARLYLQPADRRPGSGRDLLTHADIPFSPADAERIEPQTFEIDAMIEIRLPLRFEETTLGGLHIVASKKQDALSIVRAIAEQTALAVRRAELFAEVERQARTDALTGLFNHRHFHRVMEDEFSRATKAQAPLSLVMVDVDRFKSFNDRHGHRAGDAVLAAVARELAMNKRDVDAVGRWGGEEFAVLLPETGIEGAAEVAERFRQRIAELRVSIEGSDTPLAVTISAGVASYPHHSATAADLASRADKALYAAKADGRNCVRLARG